MQTSEIFDCIMQQAGVKLEKFKPPYDSMKRQLRYYEDDIPATPRYLYDADAVYFYNCDDIISAVCNDKKRQDFAERGDIMTSLWTPLTYYLRLNSERIIPKNNKNISIILNSVNEERTKKAFGMFEYLSQNYASRGNLLLLPNTKNRNNRRNLNPDKFRFSEDKIDQFLYQCLDGGLKSYFSNETDNVIEWIKSERLECLFSPEFFLYSVEDFEIKADDIDISAENLQSLIGKPARIKTYKYKELDDKEWKLYFESLNKIISYRNTVKIPSHLPFYWE